MASFAEGVPVVLMEAMASGVPVVSTSIAGVPELVEAGVSGLLVPPGDANAVAAAVSKLLADPELRTQLGNRGRAKVEREFNLATEAARLRHTLAESLAGRDVPIRPEPPATAIAERSSAAAASRDSNYSAPAGTGAVVKCA
jgi:glycosyltransferase involved in cell wall biosynthesis